MLPRGTVFGEWDRRTRLQRTAPIRTVESERAPGHLSPVHSTSISDLFFWCATAVCVVAQVAVVRAALAGRTPGASPSLLARTREFFWVILPAGLLALLLVWTWRSLPARTPAATSTAVAPWERAS